MSTSSSSSSLMMRLPSRSLCRVEKRRLAISSLIAAAFPFPLGNPFGACSSPRVQVENQRGPTKTTTPNKRGRATPDRATERGSARGPRCFSAAGGFRTDGRVCSSGRLSPGRGLRVGGVICASEGFCAGGSKCIDVSDFVRGSNFACESVCPRGGICARDSILTGRSVCIGRGICTGRGISSGGSVCNAGKICTGGSV